MSGGSLSRQSHIDNSTSQSDTGSSNSPISANAVVVTTPPGVTSNGTNSIRKMDSLGRAQKQQDEPLPLESSEVDSELEVGSMVEVMGNLPSCQYGVIRWIGYLRDKNKPIAGLEMACIRRFYYSFFSWLWNIIKG